MLTSKIALTASANVHNAAVNSLDWIGSTCAKKNKYSGDCYQLGQLALTW